CTTSDMGQTWTEHSTSRKALPEPVCMASFIRFSSTKDGDKEDILMFSNPAAPNAPRRNMSIKLSFDEGNSWPSKNHTLYDYRDCFGYSCLSKINKQYVGVLYEGTRDLYFLRFKLDELK
nr:sialidase family protein [Synergistaceae bacterium]